MSQFSYKAKEGPQRIVQGVIDADSLDKAVAKVLQLGYIPIDIFKVKGHKVKSVSVQYAILKNMFRISKKVPLSVLTVFTRQMSDLIDAGIPMMRTLKIVKKQVSHPYFKEVLDKIYFVVNDGGMLSAALSVHPEVFTPLYVSIVQSGETGGNLNVVLMRLADYLEKQEETQSHVQTALAYPKFILAVGFFALIVLMSWMMPKIIDIFDSFSQTLPLPTVILLSIYDFFSSFWWLLLGLFCFFMISFQKFKSRPAGKVFLDGLALKTPFLRDFICELETSRFARTLGTLLENGVDVMTSLTSVCLVMQNSLFQQEVKIIIQEVNNGSSLNQAIARNVFFPEIVSSMVSVGEETGQIHKSLFKLANYYERKLQVKIKKALSILAPGLILIVGMIIGFIVFALLLPLMSINLI